MSHSVTLWFDFISPYSYLALTQVEAFGREHDVVQGEDGLDPLGEVRNPLPRHLLARGEEAFEVRVGGVVAYRPTPRKMHRMLEPVHVERVLLGDHLGRFFREIDVGAARRRPHDAHPCGRGQGGFVHRGVRRASQQADDAGLVAAEEGSPTPRAGQGRDERTHRFLVGRTGVARLTLSTGAPVVPVALTGTDKLQPRGTKIPRLAPVTVRFGDPLDFSRYAGMDASLPVLRSITDEIMYAIAELSDQEYVDKYQKPGAAAAA